MVWCPWCASHFVSSDDDEDDDDEELEDDELEDEELEDDELEDDDNLPQDFPKMPVFQ